MFDREIERRPYHRDCGCALHSLESVCLSACAQQRNISYSRRQSWHDCSLSATASKSSSRSSSVLARSSLWNRGDENGVLSSDMERL